MDFGVIRIRQRLDKFVPIVLMLGDVVTESRNNRLVVTLGLAVRLLVVVGGRLVVHSH